MNRISNKDTRKNNLICVNFIRHGVFIPYAATVSVHCKVNCSTPCSICRIVYIETITSLLKYQLRIIRSCPMPKKKLLRLLQIIFCFQLAKSFSIELPQCQILYYCNLCDNCFHCWSSLHKTSLNHFPHLRFWQNILSYQFIPTKMLMKRILPIFWVVLAKKVINFHDKRSNLMGILSKYMQFWVKNLYWVQFLTFI